MTEPTLYLEDFQLGQVLTFETLSMSADDIKTFARRWDPQRLHLDTDFATALHGSLIASGFQTLLYVFEPLVENVFAKMSNVGGLGFDNLRWTKPVRPDEVLTVRMEITGATPSRSKPDRGVLSYTITARNAEDTLVFNVDASTMIHRKPEARP